MSDTQWVQHFSGQGEKYELEKEHHDYWEVIDPNQGYYYLRLPKGPNGYIPCSPPERWEVVPLDNRLRLAKNGQSFSVPDLYENERLSIRDGSLVLERKVEG